MFEKLYQDYFSTPNYNWIYLHYFLYSLCRPILYVFTAGFLYKQGFSISLVILFFGLEFGLRGFLSPLGTLFLQKYSRNIALMLSGIFFASFYFSLTLTNISLLWGFLSFILHSIAGALYYPFIDIIHAQYAHDKKRGKYHSVISIVSAIGAILGGVTGGIILEHYSFLYLASICSIFVIISQFSLCQISPLEKQKDFQIKKFIQFCTIGDFKKYLIPLLGLQLVIIMNIVFIPFYIYITVEDFQVLGFLLALVICFEALITLLLGRIIDSIGVRKLLPIASGLGIGSVILYSIFVKSALSAFFIESYNKIIQSFFRSSFNTQVDRSIKNTFGNKILYAGTAYQFILCFFEIIFLSILALGAYYVGEFIFIIAFMLGGSGMLICTLSLRSKFFQNFQRS